MLKFSLQTTFTDEADVTIIKTVIHWRINLTHSLYICA